MLLTITTTHQPATDLGYLLHKNPARPQSFPLSFGTVEVFYPEATPERCTAAMMLTVDPVNLVRGRQGPSGDGHLLSQYVNDRPYVASSFLSVAISQVYSSALAGNSKERTELAATPIPLEATLSVVPSRGGAEFLKRLFEPLGYTVTTQSYALDSTVPEWGDSAYLTVTLQGTVKLRDLLTHLYVLIPVLDNEKHYWVGDEEVEKLLRHGGGWLAPHPERDVIVRRYLKHRRSLADEALARLVGEDESDLEEPNDEAAVTREARHSLHQLRLEAALDVIKQSGATSVVDLGCGEGRLLAMLVKEHTIKRILGMDVSHRALEIAQDRLHLDRMPQNQRDRITLIQGSLIYRDKRLSGFEAAAVVEVIEHLDPPRLAAFERVVFEFAQPKLVVITTPNAEYNVKYETLTAGTFRHKDHRFEWTREQFETWASHVAERFGYSVRFAPVGPEDIEVGSPSQMGVFEKA